MAKVGSRVDTVRVWFHLTTENIIELPENASFLSKVPQGSAGVRGRQCPKRHLMKKVNTFL